MTLRIRPARDDEAPALSALALRSKAVWGYDEAFLEACRAELTIASPEVRARRAHLAEDDHALLGFFTVVGAAPEGELESLYVDPDALGRGVGRALFEAARALARREGFRALTICSDPNAESFYLRLGARRIGEVPSGSIAGRVLPLLRVAV